MQNQRPLLVYALASAGMGHATRAVPLIDRLSKKFDIHIFCAGPAKKFLGARFPNIHHIHRFRQISVGDKSNLFLMLAYVTVMFPLSIISILRMAIFLIKHRPKALITDFEMHSVYGALLIRPFCKIPIISCDHWSRIRLADPPFVVTPQMIKDLAHWRNLIFRVNPFADTFLIHGTIKTNLNHPRARYVPPPVRDEILLHRSQISNEGPIVVSMGSRKAPSLPAILEATAMRFVVFGFADGVSTERVEFKPFSEKEYVECLARAPFALVSANSSALDALALKKPLYFAPSKGQFEQLYCGLMFQSMGVAHCATEITSESIKTFAADLDLYRKSTESLDIFDNDRLSDEVEKTIG